MSPRQLTSNWFEDCSDDIKLCCSNALDKLQKHYGWKGDYKPLVQKTIKRSGAFRSDCHIMCKPHCPYVCNMSQLGGDTQIAMTIYGSCHIKDYMKAQKIRSRQMQLH